MQRVGMNNVQSHTLFLPLDFMKKNHRGQTGALVSETLPSPALCLCHFVPLCLCAFVPLCLCAFVPT